MDDAKSAALEWLSALWGLREVISFADGLLGLASFAAMAVLFLFFRKKAPQATRAKPGRGGNATVGGDGTAIGGSSRGGQGGDAHVAGSGYARGGKSARG